MKKGRIGRKGIKRVKKRRKKGELTKAKAKLWELCKQITRKRFIRPNGTFICYTSGKVITDPKNAHTGHFIASALCSPELRYDLKNLRIQSYNENINHSGNPLQFERNLIRDHGVEYVAELWLRNEQTKGRQYPLTWYQDKIIEYTALLSQITPPKELKV